MLMGVVCLQTSIQSQMYAVIGMRCSLLGAHFGSHSSEISKDGRSDLAIEGTCNIGRILGASQQPL